MTTPASPPISMANLRTEFGGSTPIRLNAYLRGGAYVPNTAINARVPTAVPIKLSQLCGCSKFTASVSPTTLTKSGPAGVVTTATTTCTPTGATSPTYSWVRQSGATQITATAATSATTAFKATVTGSSDYTAVFYCTVKDSAGATVNSTTVSVNISGTA